jgi:hypothetical protein
VRHIRVMGVILAAGLSWVFAEWAWKHWGPRWVVATWWSR